MSRLSKEGLKALYRQYDLQELWCFLEPYAKSSIRILPQREEEDKIGIGESKLGGLPDLPKDIAWFKHNEQPMAFVGQFNLAEVSSYDVDNVLPQSGMLYFFYDQELDCMGTDPNDKGATKVFYYNGDGSELERKESPEGLEHYARFDSCKLHFNTIVNIPEVERSSIVSYGYELSDEELSNFHDLEDEIGELYFDYHDELDKTEFDTERFDEDKIKLLGHANNADYDSEMVCEMVTNDCEDYDDPRLEEFKKSVDSWQLLFQMDTSQEVGTNWSSDGLLYYWIKKHDLRECEFENVWGLIQDWSH